MSEFSVESRIHWTCPVCGKSFKHANQAHSCARVKLDDHFEGKSILCRETFDALLNTVRQFGPVTLNPVKTSIQLKATTTFISAKPKRDHLEIEFQLRTEQSELPVYKTFRISRNRVVHFAILERPKDVTRKLIGLLKQAYQLGRE
jgi:hypothetical protein